MDEVEVRPLMGIKGMNNPLKPYVEVCLDKWLSPIQCRALARRLLRAADKAVALSKKEARK